MSSFFFMAINSNKPIDKGFYCFLACGNLYYNCCSKESKFIQGGMPYCPKPCDHVQKGYNSVCFKLDKLGL